MGPSVPSFPLLLPPYGCRALWIDAYIQSIFFRLPEFIIYMSSYLFWSPWYIRLQEEEEEKKKLEEEDDGIYANKDLWLVCEYTVRGALDPFASFSPPWRRCCQMDNAINVIPNRPLRAESSLRVPLICVIVLTRSALTRCLLYV